MGLFGNTVRIRDFWQNMLFGNKVLSSNEKKRLNRPNWDIKPCFLALPNTQFRVFSGKWCFLEGTISLGVWLRFCALEHWMRLEHDTCSKVVTCPIQCTRISDRSLSLSLDVEIKYSNPIKLKLLLHMPTAKKDLRVRIPDCPFAWARMAPCTILEIISKQWGRT